MANKRNIRMYQVPNYTEDVSLKLSGVLSDIDVNERMVLKRRKTYLLKESIVHMSALLVMKGLATDYIMGSQSEGTTTLELNSDTDWLNCVNIFNVIQDWSDWRLGVLNLLMIQDDFVSPGYCKLQILRDDAPLPLHGDAVPFENCIDRTGRVLLKNSFLSIIGNVFKNTVRNGPAITSHEKWHGDYVFAIPCATWPVQARQWLDRQDVGKWPSDELKRYCCSTGCVVVGIGKKGSGNEEFEWRISTSLAERCLIFSLNMTQIRCYVLMKMIIKTFIDPLCKNVISSYMCKTVLFHCIENNHSSIWRENNLLVCLSVCLSSLYNNVRDENCPHFIIPGNNLMRGKIPPETRPRILEILQHIIDSEGSSLIGIKYDNLGTRLQLKFYNICPFRSCKIVSGNLLLEISRSLQGHIYNFELFMSKEHIQRSLKKCMSKLLGYKFHNKLEKKAQHLLATQFGALLGSVLASRSIRQHNNISAEALSWISPCLNTDVASSKLKLASMLYCTRQYRRAELVVSNIEENYNPNIVEPLCCCNIIEKQARRPGFRAVCDQQGEEAIQSVLAYCVRFWPCEVHCVPNELKQEMFRSTKEDKTFRNIKDYWMDWAVADSLTFIYFLQYKIFHSLDKQDKKHKALANISRTIDQEPNLGHRETALNILGQCMEQERRPIQALQCYSLSLSVRWRNNAAKIHICRLLNYMIHNR